MIFWALDWAHAWTLGSIMTISHWHARVSNHAAIGTSHWTLGVVRGTNGRANAWALGSISSNRTCHWRTCIRHWASSSIHSTSTMHMIFWTLDWAHAWTLGSIVAISHWHARVSNHAAIGTSYWTLGVVRRTNSRANTWALGSISSNRTCHWHTCIRHWASCSIHSTSTVHMIFWALDWAHA